ncbi:hypothetical protein Tco_0130556, partial [Tanacetum coccineum]
SQGVRIQQIGDIEEIGHVVTEEELMMRDIDENKHVTIVHRVERLRQKQVDHW